MRSIFRRAAKDPVAAALDAASALEEYGQALEAIGVLTEANRERRSAALEERLVQTRHRAFAELGQGASEPPPGEAVQPGVAAEDDEMPSVAASELTASKIAGTLETYGALIVRGLLDADRVGPSSEGSTNPSRLGTQRRPVRMVIRPGLGMWSSRR